MLCEFKLDYESAEASKNICWGEGEGAIDHNTVTRWFKKFLSGYKNLNDQTRSDKPKIMNSKAALQAKMQI